MAPEAQSIVYFDNAATSWPKPPQVWEAIIDYLERVGGSPGRSGHRMSIAASRLVGDARDAVARLFNVDDPSRIAFTKNSTEALNIAMLGWLEPGDHVITSSIEHNSVMRPLRFLEQKGIIELTVASCSPATGYLDPDDVRDALRPNTRLVVVLHASNVIGNLLPLREIGAVAHSAGAPLLVDASQTAGAYPIDVQAQEIERRSLRRKSVADELRALDGLVTFYASHHAVRAEKVLAKSGYRVTLVPGPREISPNCGVALQFEHPYAEAVRDLLAQNKVQIEAIHNYRIEVTDEHLNRLRLRR